MKPRFFLFALGVPALLSVYVGCGGGADATDADSGGTRKGSTSKTGKGGTGGKGGKGGSGGDLPSGRSGAGGGELVIDEQEPDTCSHDACDPGLPLPEQCSPCVGKICETRPACCNEHWDDECTHLARGVSLCACEDGGIGTGVGGSTGTGGTSGTGTGGAQSSGKGGTGGTTGTGGAQSSGKGGTAGTSGTGTGGASTGTAGSTTTPTPSCSHTPCEEGGPLKTKCSLCAAQVCAQKASCCLDSWSAECLAVAATVQGCSCSPPSGGAGGSTGTAGSSSGKGGSATGGANGSGSNGSGSNGSGGTNGSGSNGSGGTNGSGSNGSGSNGSGSNGSGSNGSGGTNGSGSNGSGSNGSGSSSAEGGNGAGSSSAEAGNGGQAGFIVGGAGGESGGCHSPCEEGEALSQFCGLVPFGICLYDPFCCNKDNGSWNAACVGYATKLFMCPKDGDRDKEPSCDHEVCAAGGPLKTDCDECSAKVCAKDAYCCETNWDGLCIAKASELCQKCNENAGKCEHAVCAPGVALKADCEPCVAEVCKEDDYCCKTSWDPFCVKIAADYCECGKTCDHDACTRGGPLKKTCSEGTKKVCTDDPFCCSDDWDNLCVDAAAQAGACGEKCSHDPCVTGAALQADCGDCEKKICEKDPTCCDFSHGWDIVCKAEVEELCGKKCN